MRDDARDYNDRPKCDPKRKSFVACVAKRGYSHQPGEPYAPFEFQKVVYHDGDRVPDILRLPDGSLIVKEARYLEAGERYSFFRPTILDIDENGNR